MKIKILKEARRGMPNFGRNTSPRYQRILEKLGYTLGDELGSGQFGAVFSVVRPNGEKAAVKIMSINGVKGGESTVDKEINNYNTVQDARKKSKLVAKHFPKVYESFKESGYGFIVMELLSNKGVKKNLIKDIFQGQEGTVAPTGDAVVQGAYKDVRRRMYSYLTNEKSRNKILDKFLNGAGEETIHRVKQELSHLPFLQIPAFVAGKDDELYSKIKNRASDILLYTAQDAVFANPMEKEENEEEKKRDLKEEFKSNPGLLMFLVRLLEILKEEDLKFYYQNNIGISMGWIDFIRKASPVGIHNRPEVGKEDDYGGSGADIGGAVTESQSIQAAIEELEVITGLAGRDMHDNNVMIRPYTEDIVIVDLGLFKPRAEVVQERKDLTMKIKIKKRTKVNEKKGVPHYTEDGKEWKGKTHKMPDGSLMSGNPHNVDGSGDDGESESLYHLEDLDEKKKRKKSKKRRKTRTPRAAYWWGYGGDYGDSGDAGGDGGGGDGKRDDEKVAEAEGKKNEMINRIVDEELRSVVFKSGLLEHVKTKTPLHENIFRIGSDCYFNTIKQGREFYKIGLYETINEEEKNMLENTELGEWVMIEGERVPLDFPMYVETIDEEKDPPVGKPMRNSSGKKYKVYVRNPKTGNVKKITYGDSKGGLKGNWNDADARSSFAARHNCEDKKDRMSAGYWACRAHKDFGKNVPGRFW
jgi:hypothetical protein